MWSWVWNNVIETRLIIISTCEYLVFIVPLDKEFVFSPIYIFGLFKKYEMAVVI